MQKSVISNTFSIARTFKIKYLVRVLRIPDFSSFFFSLEIQEHKFTESDVFT